MKIIAIRLPDVEVEMLRELLKNRRSSEKTVEAFVASIRKIYSGIYGHKYSR